MPVLGGSIEAHYEMYILVPSAKKHQPGHYADASSHM